MSTKRGSGVVAADNSGDEGSESSCSSIEDDSADSSSSSDDAEESIGMKVARQRVVKGTRTRY